MWDVLVAFVTVCVGIYLWATWNYNYWKTCDVPFIKPLPYFGNIKDLFFMKKNSGQVYTELYWKYPEEPAVGIYYMRSPQLLLRDIDLIKTALIKEFTSFHDNAFLTGLENDLFLPLNPSMAKGERWKTLRSLLAKALTTSKMKGMYPLMVDVCHEMKEHVKHNLGIPIEAKHFSDQYSADSVASCVFSLKTNSFNDPEAEFIKMSKQVFKQDFLSSLTMMIVSIMPCLSSVLRVRFISKDVTNFFIKIVKDLYESRKQNNITRNDFLQTFLDDYKTSETVYSLEAITAITMTFFIDGYETSSTLMAFTLFMLGLYPNVQEKVREEVEALSHINYETVHDLKYLDAVINETLRLYPPWLLLTKQCTQDTVLKSGDRTYPLTKGMSVAVPVYSISRDPQYFREPTEFDPSRFYETPLPPSFFPFGIGPRACLGSNFALTQIKLALVYLIENFKILPRDEGATMPELNPRNVIGIVPPNGLWIKFENIKSE
ncbi:probable cytochrome P450 9f2 isoform X2 [Rhodnius prolixus]|uniref:probable cytochrome P450 9f2 isoform X2 n=1 Tax=Rhodnius prolixus TaxID=13249 RepID=UPI003D189BD7